MKPYKRLGFEVIGLIKRDLFVDEKNRGTFPNGIAN